MIVQAISKAARKARRQHARQRRQELRFAQNLERERLRTREEAGNRYAISPMCPHPVTIVLDVGQLLPLLQPLRHD